MKFHWHIIAIAISFLLLSTNTQARETELIPEPVFNGNVLIGTAGTPGKPPVVLVHGIGDEASESWNTTIKYLKNDYHIFYFDLPGFGRSTKANQLYSPSNYSELIKYLTTKYISEPFHLIGHSMGGAIALNYASLFPKDIQSLTVVNAAGILHRLSYTRFLIPLGIDFLFGGNSLGKNIIADVATNVVWNIENEMPQELTEIIKFPPFRSHVLNEDPNLIAGLALVLHDFSRIPQQITAETLIIWGSVDNVAPLRTGHVLNALIPNSNLITISEAGHLPFIDQPVIFHRELLKHLSGQLREDLPQYNLPNLITHHILECDNKDNQSYSGTIKRLVIKNCNDIVIRNANIEELLINNSKVTVENSVINNKHTAMIVKNSNITLTASTVIADTAIKSFSSHLDVAGTFLHGRKAAVVSPIESTIIFSLVSIRSPHTQDPVAHGFKVVTPIKPL